MIEPVVADNWATDIGRSLPWTPTGARWQRYPTWVTDVDPDGNPLPAGEHRYVVVDEYERTLRPELLDQYANGRLLLGGDRLAAGGPVVRPAQDRAGGDRLLRRSWPTRPG